MKSVCKNCDRCDKTRSNHMGQVRCKKLHIFVSPDEWCEHYYNKEEAERFYELFIARKEQT